MKRIIAVCMLSGTLFFATSCGNGNQSGNTTDSSINNGNTTPSPVVPTDSATNMPVDTSMRDTMRR